MILRFKPFDLCFGLLKHSRVGIEDDKRLRILPFPRQLPRCRFIQHREICLGVRFVRIFRPRRAVCLNWIAFLVVGFKAPKVNFAA